VRRRDTGVRPRFIAATAVAVALLAALAGCSGAAGTSAKASAAAKVRTSPVSPTTREAVPTASVSPSATPTPKPKPTPSALPVGPANAGTLPQTSALPKTNAAAFDNAVHDLWLAVATGNPGYARPAFFPEKAYEQVKAIADPESDWQGRLWLDFTLDLAAVHKLVKPGATLVKVTAPTQYEQWIPPGACYNSTGYWHLPGSRMVYREGGVTHSFGIASFISWRGDWYLIHLGALVRGGAYGIVDDPETGEGFPGSPGGC
jgi:hypothetical protein